MINNIRAAFKENFEKLKWMDKQTLQLAKNKADLIVDMIGIYSLYFRQKNSSTAENS